METFAEAVASINGAVNSVVWGIPMLVLIIGTGIFMTIRTGFFQIIRTKEVGDKTFFAIFKRNLSVRQMIKKQSPSFRPFLQPLRQLLEPGI